MVVVRVIVINDASLNRYRELQGTPARHPL